MTHRTSMGMEREQSLLSGGCRHVCGVDEAGRGPLAGPVAVAACILDPAHPIEGLDDSKRLTARQRDFLYDEITAAAISWSVVFVSPQDIDRLNILQATISGMEQAVLKLDLVPDFALLDYVPVKSFPIPFEVVVKGDATCDSIAAASVLAKVTRDRYMVGLDRKYPGYSFARHKGYPTKLHYAALDELGPCPEHRRCFLTKWASRG